ncbi:MAG: CBS domain-containing protein [Firmicutes bacterium]|nr:CBS domain-containing protein [Bacillota bacterium]
MFVKERMNKNAVFVHENVSLAKAVSIMKESRHKRLPVVDENNKPVGVINRYDIEALGSPNFLLSNTKVGDIMESSCNKINENSLLEDCALVMKDNKTNFLPVVNNDNELAGVITGFDVLKGLMKLISINGEGCRMMVNSVDAAGIANLVSRSGKIKCIIVDNGCTIVKFDANNSDEVKERVNAQYDVVYFVEK